jgi:hypothetical protein
METHGNPWTPIVRFRIFSNGCPGISRNTRSNENPIGFRADFRFIGISTKLISIEQECGAVKLVEFLKMPTKTPCWY